MILHTAVQSARPPFLILALVCVLLGVATVIHGGGTVSWSLALWVLLGALTAHVSVNAFNEYWDYDSGLDLRTQRTPFSGGSGAIPANPAGHQVVWALAVGTLLLTALVGLTIVWLHGLAIVPLGLAGLLLIVTYTQWLNRSPWLCLLAPGAGFGLFMVPGTQFALTGEYRIEAVLFGLIPFLLTNNLLLLNQYPDVEADRSVGRNHVPIAYGETGANRAFAVSWLLAGALLVAFVSTGLLSPWGLVALLPWALGGVALRGAVAHGFAIGEQPQLMAMNVMAALLTPAVLAVVLLAAGLP